MTSQRRESEWEATLEAAEDALNADDYESAADRYRRALELAERCELGDEYVADSLEGLATARSLADESAEVQAIEHRASEIRDSLLAEEEASVPPDHATIAECLDRCAFHRLTNGIAVKPLLRPLESQSKGDRQDATQDYEPLWSGVDRQLLDRCCGFDVWGRA